MAITFNTIANITQVPSVKLLIYGESGMGKTMLCATAPKPLIISAEAGLLSLKRKNIERVFGKNQPDICYDMPVTVVKTVDDLVQVYDWCMNSKEASHIRTICIDSLSEVAETVLANAKKTSKDGRMAYFDMLIQMENLIRLFRDIPDKNVYMSSKIAPRKDEVSGVIRYGPAMPGAKLGNSIPYFFDEMLRMGVNKTQDGTPYRFLQTQPDLQYEAKDRSGSLAPTEEPHLTKLFNKIIGD